MLFKDVALSKIEKVISFFHEWHLSISTGKKYGYLQNLNRLFDQSCECVGVFNKVWK